jgi:hypothetical protein
MTHEIYHLFNNGNDAYFNTIEEVKKYVKEHPTKDNSDLKVYRMTAEEGDDDEIYLSEIQVSDNEIVEP